MRTNTEPSLRERVDRGRERRKEEGFGERDELGMERERKEMITQREGKKGRREREEGRERSERERGHGEFERQSRTANERTRTLSPFSLPPSLPFSPSFPFSYPKPLSSPFPSLPQRSVIAFV